jgi:hypothetical protein
MSHDTEDLLQDRHLPGRRENPSSKSAFDVNLSMQIDSRNRPPNLEPCLFLLSLVRSALVSSPARSDPHNFLDVFSAASFLYGESPHISAMIAVQPFVALKDEDPQATVRYWKRFSTGDLDRYSP